MNHLELLMGVFIGHMVGDFMFQNKWMAVNKYKSNLKSFVHVTIYTLCMMFFTVWNWQWMLVVSIPHFLIDRYGLADKWLRLIDGRSLSDFLLNGKKNVPDGFDKDNYHVLRGSFTGLVYACVDGTMHLLCLWYGMKFLEMV